MAGLSTGDWVIFFVASYIAVIGFLCLLANRRESILSQLEADIVKEQRQPK